MAAHCRRVGQGRRKSQRGHEIAATASNLMRAAGLQPRAGFPAPRLCFHCGIPVLRGAALAVTTVIE